MARIPEIHVIYDPSQITIIATSITDCDGDGVTNADEINGPDGNPMTADGTDPLDPCDFNTNQITLSSYFYHRLRRRWGNERG